MTVGLRGEGDGLLTGAKQSTTHPPPLSKIRTNPSSQKLLGFILLYHSWRGIGEEGRGRWGNEKPQMRIKALGLQMGDLVEEPEG